MAADFDPLAVPDPAPFSLGRKDKYMSAGSCFAANVRPYLEAWGLDYTVTEGPHPQWPTSAEAAYYEAFSARYGNIYTARQMAQLLQRVLGRFSPQEDNWVAPDGLYIDPYRPGLKHRASSLHELRALTAQHLDAVGRAVERSTVLVFTLGLTEAWISARDGAVFPACPGTVSGEYYPDQHRFVNFSFAEVAADLDMVIELLRAINRSIKVILTVSPVPLVATASGRHVLAATAYSKSVLRAAADEVVLRHADVAYFPAYEMVVWPRGGESPFAEDLRTVREPVVAAVMGTFRALFFDLDPPAAGPASGPDASPISEVLVAAFDQACEEMMADDRISIASVP